MARRSRPVVVSGAPPRTEEAADIAAVTETTVVPTAAPVDPQGDSSKQASAKTITQAPDPGAQEIPEMVQPQAEHTVAVESEIIPPPKQSKPNRMALVSAVIGGAVLVLVGVFAQNMIQGQKLSFSNAPEFQALTQRVSQIEAKLASPAASATPSGTFDPASLEQRLSALETSIKTAVSPPATTAATALGDTASTDARLKAIETALAAPKGDQRSVQARESAPASQQNGPAIAIVAQSLVLAMEHGSPFETELSALEALGVSPERLGALKPFAAKGLSTPATLAEQFRMLGQSLIKAGEPKTNLGFADRLLASASSLVRISVAGDSKGDTPAALVSRINAALTAGDVAGALVTLQKLPEGSKALATSFEDSLKKHQEALASGRALLNEALGALARPKP